MQVSRQLEIQGWWMQGVEVKNGWEWVWDEWNHEKNKRRKKVIVEILDAFDTNSTHANSFWYKVKEFTKL